MSVDAGSVYSSIRVRLNDLDNDLKGVYARLDQLENKITKSTTSATQKASSGFNAMSIAGVAAFLGIGKAIKSATDTYSDFQQSMANVASVAGATSEELDMMTKAAQKAGDTTRYSASDAADALYYLASAGMNATQATQTLNSVLTLASATGMDMASTADTMSATLSQYNLDTTEASRVTNVFAAACANSQASMPKLAASLKMVGPVAGTLGISLEETTAALEALYNKGFGGEQAGTALKSILLDLVDPSSTVVAALKAQGVAYDEVNPKVVGISKAMEVMSEKGVDLTTVFGKVSAAEAIALVDIAGKATGNLRDLEAAITNTNKAALAMAIQNDTLKNSQKEFESATEAVGVSMTGTFEPAMRSGYGAASSILLAISKLPDGLKAVVGMVAVTATGVGGLAAAFGVLGISLAPILPFVLPIAAAIVGVGAATVAVTKEIKDHAKEMAALGVQYGLTGDEYESLSNAVKRGAFTGNLEENTETVKQFAKDLGVSEEVVISLASHSADVTDEQKQQLYQISEQIKIQKEQVELQKQAETKAAALLLKETQFTAETRARYAVMSAMWGPQEKASRDAIAATQSEIDASEEKKKKIKAINDAVTDYQNTEKTVADLVANGTYTELEGKQKLLDANKSLAEKLSQYGSLSNAWYKKAIDNSGALKKEINAEADANERASDHAKADEKLATMQKTIDTVNSLGNAEVSESEKARAAMIGQIKTSGLIPEQQQELIDKVNEYYDTIADQEAMGKFATNVSNGIGTATSLFSAFADLVNQINKNEVTVQEKALEKETSALEAALEIRKNLESQHLKDKQDAEDEALKTKYSKLAAELDSEKQAKEYALGLTTASTVEQYANEIKIAKATGDADKIKTAQNAYDKAVIEQEYQAKKTTAAAQQIAEQAALDKKQADEKAALEAKQAAEKTALDEAQAKKKAEIEYKANLTSWGFQLSLATASAAQGVLNASTSAAGAGWPAMIGTIPTAMALAAATGALQVAAVAAAKPVLSYATGGIVPGTSYTGDLVTANVNSGEMILNGTQQAKLYALLNGNGSPSSGSQNVTLSIGTFIGSKSSLRELNRQLQNVSLLETRRRG